DPAYTSGSARPTRSQAPRVESSGCLAGRARPADRCSQSTLLIRAHPRPALGPAAAEGGCAGLAADRQLAGAAALGLSRGGDAELLGNLEAAAPGAVRQV